MFCPRPTRRFQIASWGRDPSAFSSIQAYLIDNDLWTATEADDQPVVASNASTASGALRVLERMFPIEMTQMSVTDMRCDDATVMFKLCC